MSHPNRRDALQLLATGAAGAAASATWADSLMALSWQQAHSPAAHAVLAQQDWKPRALTPDQNERVIVLSELIIPESDTPGAKAALVNRFVDEVLQKAPPEVRDKFLQGLAWIDARSKALFNKDWLSASTEEQTALLTRLAADGSQEERLGIDFFNAAKAMTINGYYTSEIGLRRELGDPGQLFLPKFEGCNHPEHQ